jgi:Fe-S-cluster-containing dehydrogenase component
MANGKCRPCCRACTVHCAQPITVALSQLFLQTMAKEIVQSRKAVSRIAVNKAQLMSINNALVEQLGMLCSLCMECHRPRGLSDCLFEGVALKLWETTK